jgi:putative ABC transport system substrate-binding protein
MKRSRRPEPGVRHGRALTRRDWLERVGATAFLGWPVAAASQAADAPMPVVGFLGLTGPAPRQTASFLEGLAQAGFVDGRNIALVYRWADNRAERLPALAAEIVAARPAVIATIGGTGAARAAQAATASVPIVFEVGIDPVAAGLVASLARPGGNATGVYMLTGTLNEKRVQYLHEMVPRATTMALLLNQHGPVDIEARVREATDLRGLRLVVVSAGTEQEIESAFQDLAARGAGALVVANSPFFNSRREQLAAATLRLGIPAIFEWREFAVAGGLMSYGSDISGVLRQLGVYAARVLKGARPADLPILQPDRFELVINRRTAARLGLTIPQSLQLRAEVVE